MKKFKRFKKALACMSAMVMMTQGTVYAGVPVGMGVAPVVGPTSISGAFSTPGMITGSTTMLPRLISHPEWMYTELFGLTHETVSLKEAREFDYFAGLYIESVIDTVFTATYEGRAYSLPVIPAGQNQGITNYPIRYTLNDPTFFYGQRLFTRYRTITVTNTRPELKVENPIEISEIKGLTEEEIARKFATAFDFEEGDISHKVEAYASHTPNEMQVGSVIIFTVADEDGNVVDYTTKVVADLPIPEVDDRFSPQINPVNPDLMGPSGI